MLGELVDAGGQKSDLHVGRARVLGVLAVLADDLLLRFLGEGQTDLLVACDSAVQARREEAHAGGRDGGPGREG